MHGTWITLTTLLGDIPPPPPSLPGTGIPIPQPLHLAIGGGLLAIGLLTFARQAASSRGRPAGTWRVAFWMVVVLTVAGAVYSQSQYEQHKRLRRRWRPLGPVQQLPVQPEELLPPIEEPPESVPAEPDGAADGVGDG